MIENVRAAINRALNGILVEGKCGRKLLQPLIARHLQDIGLVVDTEDSRRALQDEMPVWRDKNTNRIEVTRSRRRIDLVVYERDKLLAFVETESDLDDLRFAGVSKRNGHYDVFSIASSSRGEHFSSYKSLERMAAAAYYLYAHRINPRKESVVEMLERVHSNNPTDHNPDRVGIFLVTGRCRKLDKSILEPRLKSLNAELGPVDKPEPNFD